MKFKPIFVLILLSAMSIQKSHAIDHSVAFPILGIGLSMASGICKASHLKKVRANANNSVTALFIQLLENPNTREKFLAEIDNVNTLDSLHGKSKKMLANFHQTVNSIPKKIDFSYGILPISMDGLWPCIIAVGALSIESRHSNQNIENLKIGLVLIAAMAIHIYLLYKNFKMDDFHEQAHLSQQNKSLLFLTEALINKKTRILLLNKIDELKNSSNSLPQKTNIVTKFIPKILNEKQKSEFFKKYKSIEKEDEEYQPSYSESTINELYYSACATLLMISLVSLHFEGIADGLLGLLKGFSYH